MNNNITYDRRTLVDYIKKQDKPMLIYFYIDEHIENKYHKSKLLHKPGPCDTKIIHFK